MGLQRRPTTIQPIIRNNRDTNEREFVSMRWDLVPFFTKDIKEVKGISTIDSRAETVATTRTHREPFKKRLVPASGFYEWKRLDLKNKQPFSFDLDNGKMMAFAGTGTHGRTPRTASGCRATPSSPPSQRGDDVMRMGERKIKVEGAQSC